MPEEIKETSDIIIENRALNIEEVMMKMDELQENVKYKAFGKTKHPTKTARVERSKRDAQGLDDQDKAETSRITVAAK